MILRHFAAYAALLGALSPLAAHADAPLLTPGKPVTVPGGKAGFDFMTMDAKDHLLLASHPGKGTFVVYNLQTGNLQQLDTDGKVNGEAVDRADNKLFVGGGNMKVVVFDLTTLKKTDEIALTGPADCLVFDSTNDTLYADHDDGKEIWAINGATDKITTSVPIADAPEVMIYDKKSDRLFQNIKPLNEIQVVDPSTNAVVATWPTAPMTSPHGMAIDRKTNRLFDAGEGQVDLIDMTSGKVLSTVAIAPGYVDQIAYDRSNGRLYCASKVGDISVVTETPDGKLTLLGMVPAPKGVHTLAIDPETHTVWASTYDDAGSYLQPYTLPTP
jgi:DNA-binding beta-propeller fold protein YncE